ncbi:hypothetical protein AALP_AA8G286100 [Arabis alpina]|uniref:Uncharacterized protein n=1 Tax=Arabis alpina TaxID=50452 RepID=A0A087GA34_ARAAL|nr:hypothetical protein AALP_AA8G286100 [Arabis alpina]
MSNHWFPPGEASALNPCPTSSVGQPPPPPQPPDPVNPSSNLSVQHFPLLSSLSSSKLSKRAFSLKIPLVPITTDVVMTQVVVTPTSDAVMAQEDNGCTVESTIQILRSEIPVADTLTMVLPKATSPLLTNPASSQATQMKSGPPTLSDIPDVPTAPINITPILQTPSVPQHVPAQEPPHVSASSSPGSVSLAEKIRRAEDKSLHKVNNVVATESSRRPRVKIPDAVFKKGADLHKEFIVGYFCGRAPAFASVQSVLNHIWGKGSPSEAPPERLAKIPIWANLKCIPFDLIHDVGLSHVAEAFGVPKEMNDFTTNLTRVNEAHIKVVMDVSKPLPSVIELERDNGHVVVVDVDHPWIPHSSAFCKEVGHIQRNCHKLTQKWVQKSFTTSQETPTALVGSTPMTPAPADVVTPSEVTIQPTETLPSPMVCDQQEPQPVAPDIPPAPITILSPQPPIKPTVSDLLEDLTALAPNPTLEYSEPCSPKSPESPESPAESVVPYVVGLPAAKGPVSSRPPLKSYTSKPPSSPNH